MANQARSFLCFHCFLYGSLMAWVSMGEAAVEEFEAWVARTQAGLRSYQRASCSALGSPPYSDMSLQQPQGWANERIVDTLMTRMT